MFVQHLDGLSDPLGTNASEQHVERCFAAAMGVEADSVLETADEALQLLDADVVAEDAFGVRAGEETILSRPQLPLGVLYLLGVSFLGDENSLQSTFLEQQLQSPGQK
nr:hypothetical protein [Aeromicrobium phragmitis]